MALRYASSMTQSTLAEIWRHNLQTSLLAQIGVAECRTWKRLVLQYEQAEDNVTRVRTEEKLSRPTSQNMRNRVAMRVDDVYTREKYPTYTR